MDNVRTIGVVPKDCVEDIAQGLEALAKKVREEKAHCHCIVILDSDQTEIMSHYPYGRVKTKSEAIGILEFVKMMIFEGSD